MPATFEEDDSDGGAAVGTGGWMTGAVVGGAVCLGVVVVVPPAVKTVMLTTKLGELCMLGTGAADPSTATFRPMDVLCCRSLRLTEHGQTPLGQLIPLRFVTRHSGV